MIIHPWLHTIFLTFGELWTESPSWVDGHAWTSNCLLASSWFIQYSFWKLLHISYGSYPWRIKLQNQQQSQKHIFEDIHHNIREFTIKFHCKQIGNVPMAALKMQSQDTSHMVPLVHSKIVIGCDRDNCWNWNRRMRVCRNVNNWWVGKELHDQADIIANCRRHQRRQLKSIRSSSGQYNKSLQLTNYIHYTHTQKMP